MEKIYKNNAQNTDPHRGKFSHKTCSASHVVDDLNMIISDRDMNKNDKFLYKEKNISRDD